MRNLCPRRDNNTEFKSNALSAWQRSSSSVGLDWTLKTNTELPRRALSAQLSLPP